MEKVLNKFTLLFFIGTIIWTLLSIPKIGIFIHEGFKGGGYGILFTISFILFFVILVYLLDKIKIKKHWSIDSPIGEIKVSNNWKLDMSSGEFLYLDGRLVDKNETSIWDMNFVSGKLQYKHTDFFGKEHLIEGFIKQRNLGINLGCEIYINRELIFTK